ncbi:MAG: glycosyltransferase family 1 protein [Gemmatimonadota bacterium]|nr:glycosyltransferase family 1 protein [Gemmatimonadota bacterium]
MDHGRPPLRALYCTDTYPPQVNGVSVVTALSVAGLHARGWEVEVIAPSYPAIRENPFQAETLALGAAPTTGVPSVPMPLYPDLRLASPAGGTVAGVVRRFQPSIIHSATEFMIGRMGQRAARQFGIPAVSSYHTDFSRYARSYGVGWLQGTVASYLGRFHRRSLRVYTPGHPAREDLGRMGVSEVEVWGRGVDIATFHPAKANRTLRRAYVSDETLLFLHVGRLAPEKGVDRILSAFRQARLACAGRLPMHLIIAGAGPQERALRAQADQHVTFLGNLDRATVLPRLYASADAFLFASETETLGLVVLEAMASGLPLVATPAGGVADHLRDDQNGLAFPPGDVTAMATALVRLAESPLLRQRLALGARKTAEALSWSAELDRLDVSYHEVCAGARQRVWARPRNH